MRSHQHLAAVVAVASDLGCPNAALAAPGDPVEIGDATLDPLVKARLPFEKAEQDRLREDAEALTLRTRLGVDVKLADFSILAEGESTLALASSITSAEPFPIHPSKRPARLLANISRSFGVPFLPDLKADLTYHEFDSDFGDLEYGSEWDASLGIKLGPVELLTKYANYNAEGLRGRYQEVQASG